jgi:REP element-mobilizing transposase RayT
MSPTWYIQGGKMHKNSPKRMIGDEYIYYIVTKTYKNIPYFKENIFCDLFIQELKLLKEIKKFKLFGFSIIYDHINLLIKPGREFNISQVMKSLKENVLRDINYIINNKTYVGDTSTCRQRIRNKIPNWQAQFNSKYLLSEYKYPCFKWQKSFFDHVIRNEKDFSTHWRYTVYNHIKHRLGEDWLYTSENFENMLD